MFKVNNSRVNTDATQRLHFTSFRCLYLLCLIILHTLLLSFYCWVWVGKCQLQKILKLQWKWNDVLRLNDFHDFSNINIIYCSLYYLILLCFHSNFSPPPSRNFFLVSPPFSNREVKNKFLPHPLHKGGGEDTIMRPTNCGFYWYNTPNKNLIQLRNVIDELTIRLSICNLKYQKQLFLAPVLNQCSYY